MIIEITRKKVLIFLTLLVIIIAIPLTVYVSQRQQESRSRAAVTDDDKIIITFNNNGALEQITKGDVRKVAEEYSSKDSVDDNALKSALATLEERKILDIEASKQGVGASEEEITQAENTQSLDAKDAKYEILKEKVTLIDVNSIKLSSVGFWSNPDSSSRTSAQNKELSDGLLALPQIEKALKGGDDPLETANSMLAKYPTLDPVLSVNSYVLSTSADVPSVNLPAIYEFGDSGLDPEAVSVLFSLNADDVTTITDTESNKGGFVYKIIQKGNSSGAPTYSDWLAQQKSSLITEVNAL